MNLSEVSVGEIATMKYGRTPPKSILADKGFPIFSGYRVTGHAKQYLYNDPMLVVVARGVRGTGDVKISPPNSWITNLVIVLSLDERVDQRYLFYKLGREALHEKLNTGAAQSQITIENLSPYRLEIHPLDQQKRIASVLSRHDDLIDNNLRRISLLEQAALQVYKEWFIRFRFPGHEHIRHVDGIPEGWQYQRLIDIADITMGQSPSSEFYNETGDGLPFHQGVTHFGFRFISHKKYCTKPISQAKPGDILFSVRAPVGRMNVTNDEVGFGRGLSAMRSRTNRQSFLFYQLKSHFFKEDMVGEGVIFASVNKKLLENQALLCPPDKLVDQYDVFASEVDQQIKTLTRSNEQLKEARNLLIPKLMSGEIAV